MLKYSFRVYDDNDQLVISCIVPMEHIFDFLDKYKGTGTIKCFILDGDNE